MKKPFIAVMIIPTGIGATIGGHAGDATPAARLLAGVCDTLLLHPNVVNAADLNEMPHNSLYVEGSMLDRFLRGEIFLEPVRSNSILIVCNELKPETVNCASTARVLLGADVRIIVLDRPLVMSSHVSGGIATGTVEGVEHLCDQISSEVFDALAIHTEVEVDKDAALAYMRSCETVNPWGGVEAIVSRQISANLGVPVAHAPTETNPTFNEVVPPVIAPELISVSMLFSVLKGLHKAPQIGLEPSRFNLSVDDVEALVSPLCWGAPHEAASNNEIPIIMVIDNKTSVKPSTFNEAGGKGFFMVPDYLSAAGTLVALREGISLESLRRPLELRDV